MHFSSWGLIIIISTYYFAILPSELPKAHSLTIWISTSCRGPSSVDTLIGDLLLLHRTGTELDVLLAWGSRKKGMECPSVEKCVWRFCGPLLVQFVMRLEMARSVESIKFLILFLNQKIFNILVQKSYVLPVLSSKFPNQLKKITSSH